MYCCNNKIYNIYLEFLYWKSKVVEFNTSNNKLTLITVDEAVVAYLPEEQRYNWYIINEWTVE
jgi:hypothetical protein